MRLFRSEPLSARLPLQQPVRVFASSSPVTVPVTATLQQTIHVMLAGYRRLPVLRNRKLAGMVTTSDILRAYLHNRSPNAPVACCMSSPAHTLSPKEPLSKALRMFAITGRGGFPLVHASRVDGMLTERDVLKAAEIRGSRPVREVMVHRPIVAKPEYTLADAAKIMAIGGYRRVPVVQQGILVGMLTPFDILSHLHLHRSSLHGRQQVKHAMNRRLLVVSLHTPVPEAVRLMVERGVGGLPVTEDGVLKGILTERDILENTLLL